MEKETLEADHCDDPDHHSQRSRLLAAIEGYRAGADPDAAGLIAWCTQHVRRWHAEGLDDDGCTDLVRDAIAECWSVIEHADIELAAAALQQAVWKHKKRWQRRRQRFDTVDALRMSTMAPATKDSDNGYKRSVVKLVVRQIERLMARALRTLPDRDHDLIIERHGLADRRLPFRDLSRIEFNTAAAERKAHQRARTAFRKALERELRQQLSSGECNNPLIIGVALELVEGKCNIDFKETIDTVVAVSAIEKKHRSESRHLGGCTPEDTTAHYPPIGR